MKVFLARHGEMETYDSGKPLQEHGISPAGEVQSVLLGERLSQLETDVRIYAGPSKRHVQTADRVSNTLESIRGQQVHVEIVEELDDARWGQKALAQAEERALNQREWMQAIVGDELPVDESYPDVRKRVLNTWRELSQRRGETPLLITSVIVVLVIVADALDTPVDPPWFLVNNAAITELHRADGQSVLAQVNSTGHLPGRLTTTSWKDYEG